MTNPSALTLRHPLDLDDARDAARRLAEIRREAELFHENMIDAAAEAERTYRKALARAFAERAGDGTAKAREAAARAAVADEAYQRDLKAGMVKVALERLRGLEGERSMLKSLIEFSMKAVGA